MDGTPFNYNDWDNSQPQNTTDSDCGAVKIPSGLWIAEDCTMKTNPYVCSIQTVAPSTAPPTTIATTPTVTPKQCSPGWVYYNATKSCYKVLVNLDFTNAENICKSEGAHLTSIHSLDEALWVASMKMKEAIYANF